MDCLLWQLKGKHLGKAYCWAEFVLVAGSIVERDRDWDGDMLEDELIGSNIIKSRSLLGLDEILE